MGTKVAARELYSAQEVLRRSWYRWPFAAHQGDRLQQLGFSLFKGSFASLLVGLVQFVQQVKAHLAQEGSVVARIHENPQRL